jgi:hypothetical protein
VSFRVGILASGAWGNAGVTESVVMLCELT